MNYLAHLLLAEPTPESRLGNLLPDFGIRRFGHWPLTPELRRGIQRHQRVDAFTDSHPLFAASRRRLAPCAGRFAAICVDLFYDHMLARHWRRFCSTPLPSFIRGAYRDLARAEHHMPHPLRPTFATMRREDWLGCYATIEGMAFILDRMSRRFSERFNREIDLRGGIDLLRTHEAALRQDLLAFFPQLLAHIATPHPARRSG